MLQVRYLLTIIIPFVRLRRCSTIRPRRNVVSNSRLIALTIKLVSSFRPPLWNYRRITIWSLGLVLGLVLRLLLICIALRRNWTQVLPSLVTLRVSPTERLNLLGRPLVYVSSCLKTLPVAVRAGRLKKTLFLLLRPVKTLVVFSVVLAPFMFTRVLRTNIFGLRVRSIVLSTVCRILPGGKLKCLVNVFGLAILDRILYGEARLSVLYV